MAVDVSYAVALGAAVYGGRFAPGSASVATLSGALNSILGDLVVSSAPPPPPAPTGNIAQFLTHDGGTLTDGSLLNFAGPTDSYWHRRMGKAWARIYSSGALQGLGNWLDSNLTAEGSVAYASAGVATTVDQVLTATVTTLVARWLGNNANRGFYLASRAAASAWPIDFYGRADASSANRPKLTVVTSTGTVVLTAAANACWNKTSFAGVTAAVTWRLSALQQPAILRFDLSAITGTLVSATLAIKVKAFDTGHTGHIVDIFEADPPTLVVPEGAATPVLGIAAEYANFNAMKAAVGSDARLLFADDFQSPGWADTGFTPAAPRVLNPATGTYYAVGEITGGGPPGSGTGSANVRYDVSTGVGGNGAISPTRAELFGQYWFYMEDDFGTTSSDAVKIPAMGVQFGWWNPVGYWQSTTGNGGYPGTGLKVYPATDAQALINDKYEYQGHSVRLLTGTAPLAGDDDPYTGYFGVYIYPYNLDQGGPFPASPAFPSIVIRKGAWYCFDIRVKQNSMSGSQDGLGNYATANADGVWQCWINGVPAYSNTTYRWRRHADFGVQGMWIDVYHGGQSPQPVTAHYRVDRVSLASAFIGFTQSDLVPTWVPAPGNVAELTQANGGLANRFSDTCNAYYNTFYHWYLVQGDSGMVANPHWGKWGAKISFGGGHASTNNNQVTAVVYGDTSISFKRLTNAAPIFGTTGGAVNWNDGYDEPAHQVSINEDARYVIAGHPLLEPAGPHSYGALDVVGPANGGAANGTFLVTTIAAPGHRGNTNSGAGGARSVQQIAFDTSAGADGSYVWTEPTANKGPIPVGGPAWTQYVPAQDKVYGFSRDSNPARPVSVFDRATLTWSTGSNTVATNSDGPYTGILIHVPARDLLIFADRYLGNMRLQYASVPSGGTSDPVWSVATLSATVAAPLGWSSLTWCTHSNELVAGCLDTTSVTYITIPGSLGGTWTTERVTFPGGQTMYVPDNTGLASGSPSYKKWSYDEKVRSIVFPAKILRPDLGPDSVHVFRPRGT